MRVCVCEFVCVRVRVCARTKQIEVFKYLMAVLIGVCCCVISFLSFSLFQFEIYFFISFAVCALHCAAYPFAMLFKRELKVSVARASKPIGS